MGRVPRSGGRAKLQSAGKYIWTFAGRFFWTLAEFIGRSLKENSARRTMRCSVGDSPLIRYQAAAIALKLFSANRTTRTLYRHLGNSLRGRGITDLGGAYTDRAVWLFGNLRDLGLLDGRSMSALEVGTGWMHFYGIVLALAGVPRVDLYDQWDNRQFARLQRSFANFDRFLGPFQLTEAERQGALAKLETIRRASSLPELYAALGMRYFVEENGDLCALENSAYEVVCSTDVLEHVHLDALDAFVCSLYRVMKPGGVSLHQVGLDDHLTHYDRSASKKQYIQYGDRTWNFRYANSVQYFSRVTFDRLRASFRSAGFEEISCSCDQDESAVNQHRIAPRFRDQSEQSLFAVRGYLVHRKPDRR